MITGLRCSVDFWKSAAGIKPMNGCLDKILSDVETVNLSEGDLVKLDFKELGIILDETDEIK